MLEMMEEKVDFENAWQVLNSTFSAPKKERPYIVRKPRRKFRDKDYVYVYDKDSQCGTRSFWRCERKSECPARIHTDAKCGEVLQYLKDHNHPPPDDSVISEKNSHKHDIIVAHTVKTEPVDTFDSTTLQLNNFIQTQLDGSQNEPKQEETTDEDCNGAPSHSPTNTGEDKSRVTRKRRRCSKEDDLLLELSTQPLLFWETYASTKHIINWLKNGGTIMNESPEYNEPVDNEIVNFLTNANLADYSKQLARFTMPVLLRLSSTECISALGCSSDGLLLYHSLQIYKESSTPTTSQIPIYVGKAAEDGKDIIYHAIVLKEKTESELISLLKKHKIVDSNCEMATVRIPPGINLSINTGILSSNYRTPCTGFVQVITCWKPNTAYQVTSDRTTAKLSQVNQQ